MIFKTEAEFEAAMITALQNKGWENHVLKYPTEEDLLSNWADILFENNRGIDRLNDTPLTETEMQQILEQVLALRSPLKLNSFINGKTVSLTRDSLNDPLHYGKEISLKIYDRREIAAGQSRYQIAQQPTFKSKSKILNDRRGDLMLLINGMPVFHIELKKSGIPVSQAYHQIEKYSDEGIFSGIFSLVQIFVAMQPEETVYFANPGPDGVFNKDFYFHWADFNNEPINSWKDIATYLLSIPMAHQMIGFYTVADASDGILKVMRSYQYYAANAISDRVSKIDWNNNEMLGGYIWHTTGSGKTMTSFKSAQLIANSKDADKVVFLMDRIELGTQSLREYRAFAEDNEEVQATEDTHALITKLKSKNPADTLIVTSIQKMSNIKNEEGGLNATDIQLMNSKRIVFIVDEAHRSTFGDMLITVKQTFPGAIFFGFTGTPIQEENQKKMNTTSTVFGNELHRYSIADGIRDGNVLGFDPYKVLTYRDIDLRRAVALMMAHADSEEDAISDSRKAEKYYHYMDGAKVKMAGHREKSGEYIKGIEDFLSQEQYMRSEHQDMVVQDILDNWLRLSHASKFHAIFATSSIPEAIEYYRLIKKAKPDLEITALFDPNIDNNGGVKFKEDGLVEIIEDYNARYEQDFTLVNHSKFKKDIATRLAHKKPYERIERTPEKQIDLVIVVDQMLTGFDSKWVNTLYLDKILKYENIIQAFSRTNRLFGPDKPFGTIRYYRKPHTMGRNINSAVDLYSGNRVLGLFVEHLDYNLEMMNQIFSAISRLFTMAGVPEFTHLPVEGTECAKFAKLFSELNSFLEAAKIQGFIWKQQIYSFKDPEKVVEMLFDENIYLILALRYKELFAEGGDGGGGDIPFDIDGHLVAIDTGRIDTDYMNSRFEKFLKVLHQEDVDQEQLQATLDELHKSFASLTQEEQKYANIFIHDVHSGNAKLEDGKSFRDYITEYQFRGKSEQVRQLANALGMDTFKLESLMSAGITVANINEYGRFDDLKKTVDRDKAKAYFEAVEGTSISAFQLSIKIEKLLKDFILSGGFDVDK
ncbi:type I restriction endonuclease subunit R [Acidaminobacter hydrogenoformans]|uniref:Type I restriction enzyme endonuclease subunit n=1 Tax=Acidaminobacter hydrogenoformans DSM 2784 TaxID=1120920 RepID=A0A1G5S4M5_9FIRM|nr:HsdR family type I site-specific deoxyribonuclease [Acidaminobacter hydrogenoformans]SCZ80479.1 type I restriction enzyme, R subunit [Acidaminobacter hydrogenoformans DSM 2784]